MDQHRGDQPPPRRITINDRRKLHPEAAGTVPTGVNTQAAAPEPPAGPPAPAAPAVPTAPAEPNPLEAQLEAARAEAAAYLDDLQRLKAEFDNYRKRIVKEQTGLVERASASLLHRLLPVLDNFELAVASAEESREFDRMLKGIEMVFGELKEVLTAEGLTAIAAKGKAFDPNYHEAALQVDGEEDGEAYVAEELRSGYTYKGRVLRPSMVKVARRGTG
ncbi:MAG: molecular chaperone GrpE [Actinomycetota bacterium]|jgi:molecular chaperone GrpE|nr:molecular chaperone GrpE [Actinomycetota bacterium]